MSKSPAFAPARIELARGYAWLANLPSSDSASAEHYRKKMLETALLTGVMEPLYLDAYRLRGDTIGLMAATLRLDALVGSERASVIYWFREPLLEAPGGRVFPDLATRRKHP